MHRIRQRSLTGLVNSLFYFFVFCSRAKSAANKVCSPVKYFAKNLEFCKIEHRYEKIRHERHRLFLYMRKSWIWRQETRWHSQRSCIQMILYEKINKISGTVKKTDDSQITWFWAKIQQTKTLVTCQRFGDFFYLGCSSSILQFRQNIIKVGSKPWLLTFSA